MPLGQRLLREVLQAGLQRVQELPVRRLAWQTDQLQLMQLLQVKLRALLQLERVPPQVLVLVQHLLIHQGDQQDRQLPLLQRQRVQQQDPLAVLPQLVLLVLLQQPMWLVVLRLELGELSECLHPALRAQQELVKALVLELVLVGKLTCQRPC